MLKKYQNLFFKVIQEKGLDPALFQVEGLQDTDSDFSIELKGSPLIFIVKNMSDSFHRFTLSLTKFTPGFRSTGELYPYNIDMLIGTFKGWIDDHAKPYLDEQLEPNMWERIESQTPLINGSEISQEDTGVFSEDEKIRVRMSINEFRVLLIKKFEPSKDELKVIDARLKYLSEAVDRLNKIDWRSVAITTLITISTTLALDSEKGQLLFELFKQVFSGILQLMQ